MTHQTQQEKERSADFTIPSGCIACGGELEVRLTPGKAWGYCVKCHWLSRPYIEMERDGFRVGSLIEQIA